MEVIIRDSAEEVSILGAQIVAHMVRLKPRCVLGLATGRTPLRLYTELIRMHQAEKLDFSGVETFNLDEYVGLPHDHPQSYHFYMRENFFRHVNIPERLTHVPDGCVKNLRVHCLEYEAAIKEAGGIDLQLLGIGANGHIGFNEPLSALLSRTREKALSPRTRQQNAAMFGGDADRVPRRALTMGVGTILEARELLLLATGSAKAAILAKAVEGPITAMISASALQLHPRCKVILDQAAAGALTQREYYDWLFQNEPEWEAYRG